MKVEDCGKNNKRPLRTGNISAARWGRSSGQVILEFTFCMIIVFLMIYGVTKVFFWTGRDLAARREAHDAVLIGGGDQLTPDFYTTLAKMNAIWNGD